VGIIGDGSCTAFASCSYSESDFGDGECTGESECKGVQRPTLREYH
jgi:hypothetical protein